MTRADRRTGARWGFWQARKNDVLYAIVRAATLALPKLPTSVIRAFTRAAARLAFHVARGPRTITLRNLEQVFPHLPPIERVALAQRVYDTLGGFLGEALASLERRQIARLELSPGTRETFDAALAEGRGAIFVSAHLGPWEQVASSLVAHGIPLVVIARESYDGRLDALYERLRRGRQVEAIYRGHPQAAVKIVRALREGKVVGAPMDLASRIASCDAPFLGRIARTPVGPARIALRSSAPVIVGTAERDASGAIVFSGTRVETHDLPKTPASIVESTGVLTTRINTELSRRILAWPEAWVWMHPRWGELLPKERRSEAESSTLG